MPTATAGKAPAKASGTKQATTKGKERTRRAPGSTAARKGTSKRRASQAAPSKASAAAKPRGVRNKELGRRGEDAAARFLVHRGYEILDRNWECIAGEADIVASDGHALVFVEVKTRSDVTMGLPAEAVTAKKRERYERIACLYLQDHDIADVLVRFDVVSIVAIADDRALIRHHINAWAGEDR